jgi:hypothetical protein
MPRAQAVYHPYRLTVELVSGRTRPVVRLARDPAHAVEQALRNRHRVRVLACEPISREEYTREFGPDRVNRPRGGRDRRQAPEAFWS